MEKYFKTITPEKLSELSRKGGLVKNPRKGVGSLSHRQRARRGRDAARARWSPEGRALAKYGLRPKDVANVPRRSW